MDLLQVSVQEILKASVMAEVDVISQPLTRLVTAAKERATSLPALVPPAFYLPAPPLYCPQPSPNTQVGHTWRRQTVTSFSFCPIFSCISISSGLHERCSSGSGDGVSLSGFWAGSEGSDDLQGCTQLSASCAVVHQQPAALQTLTAQGVIRFYILFAFSQCPSHN